MFCCGVDIPEVKEDKPVIVDLSDILRERAWKVWHSSFNCFQKMRLKRRHFDIEVPQNYYVFENVADPVESTPEIQANSNNNAGRGQDGMNVVADAGRQKEVVTIDTMFKNDTSNKQTYNFRFEKTRRTEMSVSFQKGFTFGTSTNFKVGLPQILGGETGLELGASTEYQVTNSKGQTFEESVVMEATSNILVAENRTYMADVKLEDLHVMKPFRSVTRMRLPQRYAPVYIKRKSDGAQVSVYVVRNLNDVFGKCACVKTSTSANPASAGAAAGVDDPAPQKYDGSWIDFITEGYVEGTFASKHQILLRDISGQKEDKSIGEQ
ncbi:hypothetical protein EGW08_019807 [Elysia chlorotica]|uniref:Uncharacterized protein n=1 Tax=Elysia chlorotica TaxID=188477 RepID=A0A433ST26_ELYCH|nr:hypothetical protein EGW08_019807 [Elysia chlorotica]